MKKFLAGIVIMGLVFSVGGTTVLAAGPGRGRNFVDADNDGICDNADNTCVYIDSDGDGICDICGVNNEICPAGSGGGNFVDEDGDGICDNYAAGQGRGNGCQGGGYGCGAGRRGNGFRGGRGR